MRYFKAQEIETPPYIQWDGWANSHAELVALGEEGNPLIVKESDIPPFEFGICPLKIVDGSLVARTAGEMEAAELAYTNAETQQNYRAKINDVNAGTFMWGDYDFPMHETARLYYECLAANPGVTDKDVMTNSGEIILLANADIADFVGEYRKALVNLTRPD